MALEYRKLDTIWHRLDPRTKLLWGLLVVIQLAIWTHPLWQLMTLAIIVLPGIVSRVPWRYALSIFKYIVPFIALVVLLESFLYNPVFLRIENGNQTVFELLGFKATLGGLLFGVNFAEKIFFSIIFISILTYTIPFTDILYLFQKIGAPYQLTFTIATAWRLAPMFRRIYDEIVDAQKARGWNIEECGFFEKMHKMIPVLVPLYNQAILYVEKLSLAMESRAFGSNKKPTIPRKYGFKPIDYLVITVVLALIATTIWLTVQGYGVL